MKSFMLFIGKSTAVQWGIFALSAFAFSAAARVTLALGGNPSACNFLKFVGQIVCLTVILYTLRLIFNASVKSLPGYRYFHSLPNAAARFRQAIITANALMIAFSAAFMLSERLMFGEFSAEFPMILFMLGWTNMFGSFRSFLIHAVPLSVIGFLYGFLGGADKKLPAEIIVIIAAAAGIFCACGILKAVITSGKTWERGE